jgi:hypothetical protein
VSTTKQNPAITTHTLPIVINAATSHWIHETAERLARNGPYEGASPAQLEARIWIGVALGIDPATACSSVTFSRGKAVLSAALQAALLARGPRYGYESVEVTDEMAMIKFFRNGKPYAAVSFTIQEAKRAGLTNKAVWQAYPSDLLFARALTRGIRRCAPDLLAGNVAYTAEEAGAEAHEPIPEKEPSAPPPTATKPQRGTVTDQQLADLKCARELLQIPLTHWRSKILAKRGVESAVQLSTEQAAELISALKTRINVMQMQEEMVRQDHELAAKRNGDLTVSMDAIGKDKGKEVAGAAGPKSKSDK